MGHCIYIYIHTSLHLVNTPQGELCADCHRKYTCSIFILQHFQHWATLIKHWCLPPNFPWYLPRIFWDILLYDVINTAVTWGLFPAWLVEQLPSSDLWCVDGNGNGMERNLTGPQLQTPLLLSEYISDLESLVVRQQVLLQTLTADGVSQVHPQDLFPCRWSEQMYLTTKLTPVCAEGIVC